MSENNSTRKIDVGFYKKPDGSRWVYVDLLKYGPPPYPRMILSFLDLHRIIRAIAECEDEKYPPPAKGRWRLLEFLGDSIREHDFGKLATKYKIPERDGDKVVNANGAKITPRDKVKPLTAADIPFGLKR